MTESEFRRMLEQGFQKGHFVLRSGLHTDTYINMDWALCDPGFLEEAAIRMVQKLTDPKIILAVIGPPTGGQILAQAVAHHLSRNYQKSTLFLFAKKDPNGTFVFPEDVATLLNGRNCLIVEDVMTTLGSCRKLAETAARHGGICYELTGCVFRNKLWEVDTSFVQKFSYIYMSDQNTWKPEACPLCQRGQPINTP